MFFSFYVIILPITYRGELMKKVKIGIIGTGVGIRTHLKGFRTLDNAEVVAIAGRTEARSKEFAEKYDIPVACADYKELCNRDDIDLICVTTPNRLHFDMVKYALKTGKHILCEKPLSDDSKEVKELIKLSKEYKSLTLVDHQLRFNPYIQKIKNLIESGTLGNVYLVEINQQGSGFANENAAWTWSFDSLQGGGVRLAMASHLTDLIQYWFNSPKPTSVTGYLNPVTYERKDASSKVRKVNASTLCTASIGFANNMQAIFKINAGSYMESRFDIHIFGDKGELTFSLQDKLNLYLRSNVGCKEQLLIDGVFEDEKQNKASIFSGSFRYFAPKLVNSILKNKFDAIKECANFDDAEYNLKILDAIKESANSGVSVQLNKTKTNKFI